MIDLVTSALIHCVVHNQSTLITRREVTKITRMCNDYAKVVQSSWHRPRGTIKVYLRDSLDDKYAGWVGLHETNAVVKLNVKFWYSLGYKDIMYPLTHEIAEAVVMPNPNPDGTGEVADPVGQDYFVFNGYKVSQFITPNGTELTWNQ